MVVMDSTGSSLQYMLLVSSMMMTSYYLNVLYVQQLLFLISTDYFLFFLMTWIMFLILLLMFILGTSLKNLQQSDLCVFNGYTFDNYGVEWLVSNYLVPVQLETIFVWESWLTVDSYSYPFAYTFLLMMTLSFMNCLAYHRDELKSFMLFLKLIVVAGFIVFVANSMMLFFLAYETLLMPSFLILYRFAKSRSCIEAAYAMFFWTQFGALLIILVFLYTFHVAMSHEFFNVSTTMFSSIEINFLCGLLFFGFGVKFPMWPFYGWLPKAHVEASANFSIFLSGVLVKFAFFGLLKCLYVFELEPSLLWVYPFLTWGVLEVISRMFFQIDLKKLIAYVTVIEMHWLVMCMITGNSPLWISGACMLVSHALISTNSFLILDAITRRFHTRLITEISGLSFITPQLFITAFLNLMLNLGFPGSLFFIAESLFFTFIMDLWPTVALYFFLFLYLFGPLFYFKGWVSTLFSYSFLLNRNFPLDMTSRESFMFLGIPVLLYWLGVTWSTLFF